MKHWLVIGGALLLSALPALSQADTNSVPQAEDVLRDACTKLAKSPQFSLKAEVWQECVMDSGEKVQFTRTVNMEVKRPNYLKLEIHSPASDRCICFDGKALIILDRKRNVYSSTPISGDIDDAIDAARDQYGIDLPLIDMAVSDPYSNATAKVQSGTYYAVVPVMGQDCHHLGFTQDNIDWQVWVDAGAEPLVRKFVIDHKNEERAPEFTAMITQWSFDPIPNADLTFSPPAGATKIEMRKADLAFGPAKRVKRLASPRDQEQLNEN